MMTYEKYYMETQELLDGLHEELRVLQNESQAHYTRHRATEDKADEIKERIGIFAQMRDELSEVLGNAAVDGEDFLEYGMGDAWPKTEDELLEEAGLVTKIIRKTTPEEMDAKTLKNMEERWELEDKHTRKLRDD